MPGTSPMPSAIQLGARLRTHRNNAGLTMKDLASKIGLRDHSPISKWENGKQVPSDAYIGAAVAVLAIDEADREELLKLAREASDPNWVAPGVDRQLAALMEYERGATSITNVEPMLIPGLLQTADYARALVIGNGGTRGEVEQRVMLRMGRRDILTSRPVQYDALIGEHALRCPPCDHAVMAAQLRHLQEWSTHENVCVRAVPMRAGYSPAMEGPFVLVSLDGRGVVQLEHYRSTLTITDTRDVRDYEAAAEEIRREAMSPEATSELIAEIHDEMESSA